MQKKFSFKKYISLLLAAVLLLGMGPYASAATNVVFTVVNDQFLDLSDSTMPIIKDGSYYVPYTVFLTGFGGIRAYYASQEQVLVLYDKENVISFDIAHGYTYDQQMRTYNNAAFTKNGTVFVPASFVCSMWGFYYSVIPSARGTIVRISKSSPALTDSMLLSLGDSVMAALLTQYNSNNNSNNQQDSTFTETPVETTRKIVYLTFDSTPDDAAGEILDSLARYGYTATFFCNPQMLIDGDDIVRRIIAEGHTLGLNANSLSTENDLQSPEAIVAQLSYENAQLEKIAKTRARLVRITDAGLTGLTEEIRNALYLSGYRLWDYTVDVRRKATSYSTASAVVSALEKTSRPSVVIMDTLKEDAGAMKTILSYLKKNNYIVLSINDWDAPINAYQDIR